MTIIELINDLLKIAIAEGRDLKIGFNLSVGKSSFRCEDCDYQIDAHLNHGQLDFVIKLDECVAAKKAPSDCTRVTWRQIENAIYGRKPTEGQ